MMCNDLIKHLNGYGVVLMLTIALLSSSCCSSRKAATKDARQEAESTTATTAHAENLRTNWERMAQTIAQTTDTDTESELLVVVYDTSQPTDSTTGARPVAATARKRTHSQGRATTKATTDTEAKADARAETEQATSGQTITLDEVTVTAPAPSPGLWARIKQGAGWAVLILILAASGWFIYKFRKNKEHG